VWGQALPKATTPEEMIAAMVTKNIFKPAKTRPIIMNNVPENVKHEPASKKLEFKRPFLVAGVYQTDEGARANLLFSNPTERRVVKAGDKIEFVTILEIIATCLICQYGQRQVRIGARETSDDVLAHLMGFSEDYELMATTVLDDESYAHFLIQGRSQRVVEGDRLGEAEVVKIEDGKVRLRLEDGYEFDIKPSPMPKRP